MMGARSHLSLYSISSEQERFEAEEYNLEDVLDSSCPVPVETAQQSLRDFLASKPHAGGNTTSALFRSRGILKKNHFAYRNLFLESPSPYFRRSGVFQHRSENGLKRLNHDHRKTPPCWTARDLSKDINEFKRVLCEDSSPANRGKPTSAESFIATFHDEPVACPCCACHVLDKKGCERFFRGNKPRSRLLTTMGDLEGICPGKGKNRRRAALGGHQPPFLKTVSIIETLSELGPEVSQLAEEPRYSPRLHPASRSSRASTAFTDNKDGKGPSLPLVSAEFQQYTEKIYDAVTRRPEIPLTEATKNSSSRLLQLANPSKGVNQLSVNSKENGLGFRFDDQNLRRKIRHGEHRGRERGRTPDWIKRIFNIAKKGELEQLKLSITDMEGTLVRNLSDHAGNNLLHVMAVFGHLEPMSWLLTSQPVLVDGLQDENKFGLTPLVCAIKYGHLHLVQWLVENTRAKEKVRCKDGERSLLHIGAKYAQEQVVAWLVDYMMTHEISLDNKDHHGNTALHLASRTGNSRICTILLQHGADVTLKNDLGQKAWEVCVIRGHSACAEYLCVHESGLALASDLTRRESELEAATSDNHDLRINFKEAMSVARRLSREREEAVRELSRLHDQMVDAHDNIILALQELADENSSLRERVTGVRQPQHPREQVESVIGYITNLHDKWQSVHKTWFGSPFVDMKHRLLLVEESWKKLRHRSHRTVASTHHPLDIFRGKLCAVRAQGGEGRLGDLPSLCSSEESIASLFPFSDEEDVDKSNEEASQAPISSTPAKATVSFNSQSPSFEVNSNGQINSKESPLYLPNLSMNAEESQLDDTPGNIAELEETLSASTANEPEQSTPIGNNSSAKVNENVIRPYWTDPSLSASLSALTDLSPGERLPKETISARLKELALTSESGSCSVLEVIEPSSEESDILPEDDKTNNVSMLTNDEAAMHSTTKSPTNNVGKRLRKRSGETEPGQNEIATTSSESGPDCSIPQEHQRSETQAKKESKHFLANETSSGTAAVDVSDSRQRSHDVEEQDFQVAAPTLSLAISKRKGFLRKFIKPPKWSSKGKIKTLRKADSEPSRDFKDPYSLDGVRSTESFHSLGDADLQTSPESNTSSSHEYSNSSEESSIDKPTVLKPVGASSAQTSIFEPEVRLGHSSSYDKSNFDQNIDATRPLPLEASPTPDTPPPVPSRRTISSSASICSQPTERYNSTDKLPVQSVESIKKFPESRFAANSEDSGIVARPSSSASKSESISRPESSSSSFPPFKSDYSLQKSNLSLTQDMLPTPDSSTAGRMSPAPSEVSKTESALSPPFNSSDFSKSESSRQTSLGKASIESSTNTGSNDYSVALLPLKKELSVKTAAIIDISCDQKGSRSLSTPNEVNEDEESCSEKERPWYEVSDEESDILIPERLTAKLSSGTSSSEEEVDLC